MADDISKEVLELSYQELQARFEYRLQELEAIRTAAERTFTGSLILVSVIAAVVSAFPEQFLLQYGRKPITGPLEIAGPIIGALGVICLFSSFFTSLEALREIPQSPVKEFSTAIPDAVSSEYKQVGVDTSDSIVFPRESEYQWYQAVTEEYANIIQRITYNSKPFEPEKLIKLSYYLLLIGPVLILVGIWITIL